MIIVPEPASKQLRVLMFESVKTTWINAIDIGDRYDDVDKFAAYSHKRFGKARENQYSYDLARTVNAGPRLKSAFRDRADSESHLCGDLLPNDSQ